MSSLDGVNITRASSGRGGKSGRLWEGVGNHSVFWEKAGSSVGKGGSLLSLRCGMAPLGRAKHLKISYTSVEGHWPSLTITLGSGGFNASLRDNCLIRIRGVRPFQ